MKENETINTVARKSYEPVSVTVPSVAPQGILCASGGSSPSSRSKGLQSYKGF